ncbi:MAG: hypothetical protein EBV06_14815 [Planctomycetia bacterium]|nr:hypothetical protein [Planctomycetia bacterium]
MSEPVKNSVLPTRKAMSPLQVFVVVWLVAIAAIGGYWWFMPQVKQNITGTVTRGGKALVWPKADGQLHVIFVPEIRRSDELPTRAECDSLAGTFRVANLRSGSYRVAVHMFDEHHMDALRNQFDPGNSPIYHRVTADNQVINIDLP